MHMTQDLPGNTTRANKDIPDGPRQEIAAVFFSFDGYEYLLICDPFSKYPFLFQLPRKTAEITKQKIKQIS